MKILSKLLSKYLGNSKTSDEFVSELKRGGGLLSEKEPFFMLPIHALLTKERVYTSALGKTAELLEA